MPATKTKNSTGGRRGTARAATRTPPTRARRSVLASRPWLRPLRDLSPQQIDVLALALVAIGIFLGGVAYFGWTGGAIGHGAMTVLKLLFGALAYVAPVVFILGGIRVLARDATLAPASRPLRSGALCLTLALALALAAGTLGIGPGPTPAHGFWAGHTLQSRGGVLGGALYWIAERLLSVSGADILAIFLALAGLILLSGATVGSVVRASHVRASQALHHADFGKSATKRAEIRARRLRESGRYGGDDPLTDDRPTAALDMTAVLAGEDDDETPIDPPEFEAPVGGLPLQTPEPDVFEDVDGQRSFAVGAEDGVAGDDVTVVAPATAPAGEAAASRPQTGPRREVDPEELTPAGRYRDSVLEDPEFVWQLPSSRFLVRSTGEAAKPDTAGLAKTGKALVEGLASFGVDSKLIGQVSGPHITRFELRLRPGIKMSKVANLKDDIAYALAATDIRILAPIPGKTAVGVEVPNARRRIVHLGDVYQPAPEGSSPLNVWLGKDIAGNPVAADLAKMPHLLVAGTTGAGKSACINAMLCSILLGASPHDVRMVLVDPKQVELSHYDSVPHLLTPVVTDPRVAAYALQNLVREMESRYGTMELARTRSLPELNRARAKRGQAPLPYILCVIDELADLMMVAGADVEDSVIRLAQKARAVGIHLVVATQSPRVDVITGMIKANMPSRIAFAVSSQTDSRVILDQNGAESLLGRGDMLFSPVGSSRLQRIQGAFIDEEQIAHLTGEWRKQGAPEFREELLEEVPSDSDGSSGGSEGGLDPDEDPLLPDAIGLVAQMGTASTSMLQRRLRLGYTRAGRLIDMLERRGIISGYEGSKPRQVLISEGDVPRLLLALNADQKTDTAGGHEAAHDAGHDGEHDRDGADAGAGGQSADFDLDGLEDEPI
jgi:S-DNA-T family DNA segregation ATPase FtsK/SpoIIIE